MRGDPARDGGHDLPIFERGHREPHVVDRRPHVIDRRPHVIDEKDDDQRRDRSPS
jgi:hypothetical protein